jgi:hypothetical protein
MKIATRAVHPELLDVCTLKDINLTWPIDLFGIAPYSRVWHFYHKSVVNI